jgi:hypothetical protein
LPALILAAAFIHASWNFLLKRSRAEMPSSGSSHPFYGALRADRLRHHLVAADHFGWQQYGFMAAARRSTVYYLLLDRGYRSSDFSLVYPMARGTRPLITCSSPCR